MLNLVLKFALPLVVFMRCCLSQVFRSLNGMNKNLKKNYESLILMIISCHGTVSFLWHCYRIIQCNVGPWLRSYHCLPHHSVSPVTSHLHTDHTPSLWLWLCSAMESWSHYSEHNYPVCSYSLFCVMFTIIFIVCVCVVWIIFIQIDKILNADSITSIRTILFLTFN